MQNSLDNITRYWSTPGSLKLLCGTALLCLTTGLSATAALAQDEEQDNTLEERFHAEEDDDSVAIQTADQKILRYRVVDESTDDRILVTLVGLDGQEVLFSYDEPKSEIAITSKDTELQVTIVDDKKVVAIDGHGECPWEDYKCIVDKVEKVLGDFEAEDLAAVAIVMDDELREMDDGHHIGRVMVMLTDALLQGDL